jgi:hypothetical protein
VDNGRGRAPERHPAAVTSIITQGIALLDSSFPLPLDRPFTTAQAAREGVPRHVLTTLVRDSLLRRLLKGVYVAAQVPDSLLLRCRALALVAPPGAVVTDRTAGWLHSGNTLAPNDHLEVPPVSMFRRAGSSRLRTKLTRSGERTFLPEDTTVIHGLEVTTELRTAWDLGRLLHRDQAIGGLDAMLRLGRFSKDRLVGGVERFRGQRGVVQLRELAPLADGRAESPGESTLRLRWLDAADLPRPQPQLPVFVAATGSTYFLDLGVEELRYAAEYDGERWHSSDEDVERDRVRRTLLRETCGFTIDVLRRENVYGPRQDASRILYEGIRRARRRLGLRRPTYLT